MQRVDATSYYDFFPSSAHMPGDIWVDLPSFGILRESHVCGIVVTPACDLSNRKIETITYLPVVPVSRFFSSQCFVPELKRAISGQLQVSTLKDSIQLGDGFTIPDIADLDAAMDLMNELVNTSNIGVKEKTAIERATAGMCILRDAEVNAETDTTIKHLTKLLSEKDFEVLAKRFITNGRADIHFLPCDMQSSSWSAITQHSVSLFRYPLTIPLEILDEAQNVAEENWPLSIASLQRRLPCVQSLPRRPMKRLRLQPRYLSDLITRFTGMFGRIGSPDFTDATITRFAEELRVQ